MKRSDPCGSFSTRGSAPPSHKEMTWSCSTSRASKFFLTPLLPTSATGCVRYSASVPESRSPISRVASDVPRLSVGRLLRSRRFWETRALHSIARALLLVVVGVLLLVAIAFIVASGRFSRYDLVAVALYAGLAAFAWHPVTAAFIVMLVGGVGVVFTGSGGDLIELALAGFLVAATCSRSLILSYVAVLASLTVYLDISTATLTDGGIFGIAGIASISVLAGISFRLITAREALLVADRKQLVRHLEGIVHDDLERIADELHDGIAHDLTLVLFHARALPKQPDAASRDVSVTTIEESAERALLSIQSLLSLMRGPELEALRPEDGRSNESLIETVSGLGVLLNDAGIPTRVIVPEVPLDASHESQGLLTVAAIESVTNILKHAPKSQSARISLRVTSDSAEVVISNVGTRAQPTAAAEHGGRGLIRSRQRLEQHGGLLEAGGSDSGWTVRATAPR